MTARLEKVIEEAKLLTPDEQKQLREALDQLLAEPGPQMTEEEFQRRLLERGIISEIRLPITDLTPYENRKPIEVEGKPVSEIIIEERR